MGDELVEGAEGAESEGKRGLSRRAALKAGVAVGVGAVAWSGASITSLGGTPAYAITVSGITKIDLNAGCRNTDQATNCLITQPFRYHTLNAAALPPGFCLANNPGEGTCCGAANPPELRWDTTVVPSSLRCEIVIDSYVGQQACKDLNTTLRNACGYTISASGTTCVNSIMPCNAAGIDPNTFYTIYALCATSGTPPPPPNPATCNNVPPVACTNGPTC